LGCRGRDVRELIERTSGVRRAGRHRVGKLIDVGQESKFHAPADPELLNWWMTLLTDLGSRGAVEYVHTIMNEGTSADPEDSRVYQETGDLRHAVSCGTLVGPNARRRQRARTSSAHAGD